VDRRSHLTDLMQVCCEIHEADWIKHAISGSIENIGRVNVSHIYQKPLHPLSALFLQTHMMINANLLYQPEPCFPNTEFATNLQVNLQRSMC
jgi:hypothetical protein